MCAYQITTDEVCPGLQRIMTIVRPLARQSGAADFESGATAARAEINGLLENLTGVLPGMSIPRDDDQTTAMLYVPTTSTAASYAAALKACLDRRLTNHVLDDLLSVS